MYLRLNQPANSNNRKIAPCFTQFVQSRNHDFGTHRLRIHLSRRLGAAQGSAVGSPALPRWHKSIGLRGSADTVVVVVAMVTLMMAFAIGLSRAADFRDSIAVDGPL